MVYYFAYGSNMDKKDLDKWCERKGFPTINFSSLKPAKLEGYRLEFNYLSSSRNGGAANLMKDPGKSVYGLLMELSEKDFEKIRKKEGAPTFYQEMEARVTPIREESTVKARTFKVRKKKESEGFEPPTSHYLSLLTKNAKTRGFPEEYITFLESIKTKE
jgi:hypothetical protein